MIVKKTFACIIVAATVLMLGSWILPSWERMALPGTATEISENKVGPSGITMDVLYELSAHLTENEFVTYATKLKLRRISEDESGSVRTLPARNGERILFVGDCNGSIQTWAVYSEGRMHYWNSVGY